MILYFIFVRSTFRDFILDECELRLGLRSFCYQYKINTTQNEIEKHVERNLKLNKLYKILLNWIFE